MQNFRRLAIDKRAYLDYDVLVEGDRGAVHFTAAVVGYIVHVVPEHKDRCHKWYMITK